MKLSNCKKIISFILCVLMLLSLLTACDGNKRETTVEETTAEETTVEETTAEETTAEETTAEETTAEETTVEETTAEETTAEETTAEETTVEETTVEETQPNEEPVEPTMPLNEYKLKDIEDKIKTLGRTNMSAQGLECDLTASGFAFKAYVENEIIITVTVTAETYYTVYVDGVRLDERFKVVGTGEIKIDKLGAKRLRTIEILKQTEAQYSLSVIKKLKFNGELADAPENKKLYIEAIGDSITSGQGNLCVSGTPNGGRAPYQDGTATYAYLAAEALGADYTAVSCSGVGIDYGWTKKPGEITENSFNIGDYYPCLSYYRSKTVRFKFAKARVPDIIIINLGTNDASFSSDVATYKQNVKDLIEYIRKRYDRDIPIVWVYNMMGNGYFTHTKVAIDEMGGEKAGLYYVQMTQNNGGGSGHPTGKAHAAAAERLVAFLKAKGLAE